MKIMIVTSPGGHLFQSFLLKKWWQQRERMWISLESPDTKFLLQKEKVYYGFGPNFKNPLIVLKNFFLACWLIYKEKPSIVFSTGAGIAPPFFWAAKIFAVKTVYLEAYDFITDPSLTAKLVRPCCDYFLCQHKSLKIKGALFWGSVL